ncbi:hypothetical protein HDV05_006465 [Chytridiales sp. JEL 0842]|nr:hypothetical protein HDV05_006465 [Chytridiales sp. JEL 0842]
MPRLLAILSASQDQTCQAKWPYANLWNRLPIEIKSRIFKFADPLTRYLNGPTPYQATDEESTKIWLVAFDLDWKGDLTKLPQNGFPDVFNGLCNVQSREMYDNLCRTMPDLCFEGSMNDILVVCDVGELGKEYAGGLLKTASRSLINIAIRRRWEDKLVDVIPLVSDIYSCYFVIEDAVVDATARLRRTMPHLFADSADGVVEDIYYPTEYLLTTHRLDRLQTLIDLGYRMSAWDTYGDSDCTLWLYNKNYISFVDLEDHDYLRHCDLLNLCLKSPSLILDIKAFRNDILFDTELSELYEDAIKLIIENELNGYDTYMWIDIVAANHSLELLQYIHNRFPFSASTEAMDMAALYGRLENVKFLHFNRSEGCTVRAMEKAAANGHLEVVKFLHTNRTEGCTTSALDSAAYNGHLEVVQFLLLNLNRSEGGTLSGAFESVRKGHDAVAKYLLESCKLSDENVNYNFFNVGDARNLIKNDIYKTLLGRVPKLAKSIFSIGLECGHTDMVKHAMNVPQNISSSTAFLKYFLNSPNLLDPTYVISELIDSTNTKKFGKSLIIATSSALDWDLLTLQNNMMLLGIVLPVAKNRLKGVCVELVKVLTFKGRLDHSSWLVKDAMEFLRLLGRTKV